MWFSLLSRKDLADSLKEIRSHVPQLTYTKINARPSAQKVTIRQVETMIRNWFEYAEVTEHEVIYLPVYTIRYTSRKGTRSIMVNGYTKKLINS